MNIWIRSSDPGHQQEPIFLTQFYWKPGYITRLRRVS